MDPAGASSSAIAKTENYLYLDPRSANARGSMPPSAAQARSGANQVPGGLGSGFAGGGGPITTTGLGTHVSFGQRRQGFSEAIVFAVGGGSMDEYGNLQAWAKRTGGGISGGSGTTGTMNAISTTPSSSSGGVAALAGAASGLTSGSVASANRRRVVYGSTELLNAREFIFDGLTPLGEESR